MKTVLVTGSEGFIGKNLIAALRRREEVIIKTFTSKDGQETLDAAIEEADIIYHLAGINRPETDDEFIKGNVGLTQTLIELLDKYNRKPAVILSSTIQAILDNPYGQSKKASEDALINFNQRVGAPVCIYRLPNVFGKWSRPNYNTVVATFCYNIIRNIEINISDPNRELELVYIDDVIESFLKHLDVEADPKRHWYDVTRRFSVTLGELVDKIRQLHAIRETLTIPDCSDDFMKCLYATYLSFLPEDDFAYPVKLNTDKRGWLFELLKSEHFGQIFVSTTLPGITRGNHYHNTKLEKFCVVRGEGVIRFRSVISDKVLEYIVNDKEIKVVDIPPGYTHSIKNVGTEEMIVLFWANQIFDAKKPDTFFSEV